MPGSERHHLGDWVCRAANGVTARSNSCLPIGDPGLPFAEAITQVEGWFEGRRLVPVFQIWDGCDEDVIGILDARGYVTGEGAEVLTRDLSHEDWPRPSTPVETLQGADGAIEHLEITDRIEELAMSSLTKLTAMVCDEDARRVRSAGVGVLDGSALGIFAMHTHQDHQRRGLASSVVSALLSEGVARQAQLAWLQVMPSNETARHLYDSFGFGRVTSYHYRSAPRP